MTMVRKDQLPWCCLRRERIAEEFSPVKSGEREMPRKSRAYRGKIVDDRSHYFSMGPTLGVPPGRSLPENSCSPFNTNLFSPCSIDYVPKLSGHSNSSPKQVE